MCCESPRFCLFVPVLLYVGCELKFHWQKCPKSGFDVKSLIAIELEKIIIIPLGSLHSHNPN